MESMHGLGGGGKERRDRELPPKSVYTGSSDGSGGGGRESRLRVLWNISGGGGGNESEDSVPSCDS